MLLQESGAITEAAQERDTFIAKFGKKAPFGVASIFAWQGDSDRAFEWLDKAYARHDGLALVKESWPLREIRSDPRYRALLDKMKFPLD